MTSQHPKLTPPPELVQQLYGLPQMRAIDAAFQAGADQELEACCEWLKADGYPGTAIDLRAARRPSPKPPSLKEQALAQLSSVETDLRRHGVINTNYIRRALEALSDD